jgi:hypothetical protein
VVKHRTVPGQHREARRLRLHVRGEQVAISRAVLDPDDVLVTASSATSAASIAKCMYFGMLYRRTGTGLASATCR